MPPATSPSVSSPHQALPCVKLTPLCQAPPLQGKCEVWHQAHSTQTHTKAQSPYGITWCSAPTRHRINRESHNDATQSCPRVGNGCLLPHTRVRFGRVSDARAQQIGFAVPRWGTAQSQQNRTERIGLYMYPFLTSDVSVLGLQHFTFVLFLLPYLWQCFWCHVCLPCNTKQAFCMSTYDSVEFPERCIGLHLLWCSIFSLWESHCNFLRTRRTGVDALFLLFCTLEVLPRFFLRCICLCGHRKKDALTSVDDVSRQLHNGHEDDFVVFLV